MAVIHDADSDKAAEIAAYMNENPSLQLGIDGSTNPRATTQRDQDLRDRRVRAIRDSLIHAGVPANRISGGMFGDVNLRRNGRVEVLLKTDQYWQAQSDPAGPTGVVETWVSYQDFWFDADRADVHTADASKVNDIAAYIERHPSLQVGIDSSMNPAGTDQRSRDLATRRGNSVRDALIAAGVPASSIKSGAFGDSRLRRDRRVEVLIKTDHVARAR